MMALHAESAGAARRCSYEDGSRFSLASLSRIAAAASLIRFCSFPGFVLSVAPDQITRSPATS